MSRLDAIEALYETAEYREAIVADVPFLLAVARAAERLLATAPLDEPHCAPGSVDCAFEVLRAALAKED